MSIMDEVMDKAYAEAEMRVYALANSIQSHFLTMQMNDLSMSASRELKSSLDQCEVSVVKSDDLHYQIVFSAPDRLSDEARELMEFYFNDSKQYVLG